MRYLGENKGLKQLRSTLERADLSQIGAFYRNRTDDLILTINEAIIFKFKTIKNYKKPLSSRVLHPE